MMWNYLKETFNFMSNVPEQHFKLLSSFEYKTDFTSCCHMTQAD